MNRFGLFRAGGLDYAISLMQIQKITQDGKVYSLPRLPRAVLAVLVDNDQLIPLLNLGLLFGEKAYSLKQSSGYQVLVESEYGIVALPADLSGRIVTAKQGTLSIGASAKEAWIIGEFSYQNTKYKILDINFLAIEMTQDFWRN